MLSLIASSLLILSISSVNGVRRRRCGCRVILPRLAPCDRTDCAAEPQRCQGVCALLLNEAAVLPLSLASRQYDNLPTGNAGGSQATPRVRSTLVQ